MRATLYDLTQDWLELLNLLEDPEVDEEVIWDTLEAIDGEIETKADGYAKMIRQVGHDIEGFAYEIKRMQNCKRSLENRMADMKKRLQDAMELTGKTKFKTKLFGFSIQANPPAFKMDAESVYEIPEEFLRYREPEVDTEKAKKFLKENKAEWGHLEQSKSLRIR